MLLVLAGKSALFADYARVSAMKDATSDAIDVTDHDHVKKVVSDAQNERQIIELERARLGLGV